MVIHPPVNGLDYPWSVSRRCLGPRWFVGDPTSLACDNIILYYIPRVPFCDFSF